MLSYGDFDVTLHHSKVSDSAIPSEIQGEDGALVIEKISECQKLAFVPRGGKAQDLTQPQHINTMLYEAETFARPVETQDVDHPGLGGEPDHRQTVQRNSSPDRGDLPGRYAAAGVKECKGLTGRH